MNEALNKFELKKLFARALDPIHIGAGGYRLGRVDNTIVREPATGVPKIPGTSFAGVVRAFYTLHLMETECKEINTDEERRACAEEKAKTIFGDENKKGLMRFYDGQIIFFPVSSIQGTIWITTKELLEYWFDNNKIEKEITNEKALAVKGIEDINEPLNLGWLLLEIEKNEEIQLSKKIDKKVDEWVKKVVIVSEKLFSHIVNDNLEVRTSVKINHETGTAELGGLFTYEAIPRGTVFGFEVGIDIYSKGSIDIGDVDKILKNVSPYFKILGIGGMGTRGFGRIELVIDGKEEGHNHDKS